MEKTENADLKSTVAQMAQESIGYRKLGVSIWSRDLSDISQSKMFSTAYWLWERYPIARWIIDIIVAFICAEGIPWKTKNKKLGRVLESFWCDPVNRLEYFYSKHITGLHIFGELCLPVSVSPSNGTVRHGLIDPAIIENVYTDPQNVMIVTIVELRKQPGEAEGKKYKTILHKDIENFLSPAATRAREAIKDECFYFSINNLANSPRGRSTLLTVADWIDVYENFLYDYAEKWSRQNSHIWDIKVTGGKDKDVEAIVNKFMEVSSTPGSTFGHNDQVEVNATAPKLNSVEVAESSRLFRNHILGGAGIPTHWYGGGEDTNKATASEMSLPTMKIFTMRQKTGKYILKCLFDYQIEQAIKFKKLSREAILNRKGEFAYSLIVPELYSKDLTAFGQVIKNIAEGLTVAETNKWIDADTARDAIVIALSYLGKEIDAEEIKDNLSKGGKNAGSRQKVSGGENVSGDSGEDSY